MTTFSTIGSVLAPKFTQPHLTDQPISQQIHQPQSLTNSHISATECEDGQLHSQAQNQLPNKANQADSDAGNQSSTIADQPFI